MSQPNENDHDTLPPSMDPAAGGEVVEPPKDFIGILKRLGPGLIIAGSIVGSGELIATTKTGAQAGMTLLWLVIIGCVIKVFVQIELGRYTISHGETTLAALDRVPGPRMRVNWIVWFWLIMMLVGLGQVGGIVGGVGQALALAFPIKGDYVEAISVPSEKELKRYIGWNDDMASENSVFSGLSEVDQDRITKGRDLLKAKLDKLNKSQPQMNEKALAAVRALIVVEREQHDAQEANADAASLEKLNSAVEAAGKEVKTLTEPKTYDDKIWAAIVTLITIAILFRGGYGLIQNFSTVLVVTFTFVTIGNVIALQLKPEFSMSISEILGGLWFSLPDSTPLPPGIYGIETDDPVATALATFGIIGVGASELVMYPYWCLEKGYAKYAGPRSSEQSWVDRARGWMKVMHYDAFASMLIYTTATLAFFLMGVAVMYEQGLDPEGSRMTSTLLEQYVPVFGTYAKWLFLAGAIAVLYSTFLVSMAGFGRIYTDALKVYGLLDHHDEKKHNRWVSIFCTVLPLICLAVFCTGIDPTQLVLLGGTMQALMLPILGLGALYMRFKLTDARLKPSGAWDLLLIISCLGLAISGGWKLYGIVVKLLG
ncbi:MAG: Nramp family divalent metal transporter [Planctomycetaceae bacterium]|jgi:Mn2+/Fe2+ NRAMP family transporter|nr:Nramp family divalent metal transporter [Planctomycetaceae bacterium]MBT6153545.1 Nramp family divalent metal transporter [Planctomycetaceae bacterium]MBT6483074.1 Nramp family divalent metal transporter [Planctomycetaceae bacterium]MBT6495377.1 Nramp family divalent metal transporter [Planctomycetaceae bacterium]